MPSRLGLIAVVALGIVALGQLIEDIEEDIAKVQPVVVQMLSSPPYLPRWAVIAAVMYMLAMSFALDRTVRDSLGRLRDVVQVADTTYRDYARRMAQPDSRADAALLAISAVCTLIIFVGTSWELPLPPPGGGTSFLPAAPASVPILIGYVVVGWAGLRMLYMAIRIARSTARLAREPLMISVFDTTALLPFGRITLLIALVPAGVVVILSLGLPPPTGIGWVVLLMWTATSILALLLPLRGIHAQMADAKRGVLGDINDRLEATYQRVRAITAGELKRGTLDQEVNILVTLRKTVQEMTTWPFEDTFALARALVIASAPLITTVLSQLILATLIGGDKP